MKMAMAAHGLNDEWQKWRCAKWCWDADGWEDMPYEPLYSRWNILHGDIFEMSHFTPAKDAICTMIDAWKRHVGLRWKDKGPG